MAGVSKNTRDTSGTHRFNCSCGGEIKMKSVFINGRMRHSACCDKCKREERKPRNFS